MKTYKKSILIWIIVILALTNISTIATIVYHSYFSQDTIQKNNSQQIEIPDSRLGRFFKEELNLNYEQHQQFRSFRQKFHREANILADEMQVKRNELMIELRKEKSDSISLDKLAREIGNLHSELKHLTFEYYLEMKNVCTDEQKEKLFQIFNSMTNQGAEFKMPYKKHNKFKKEKDEKQI